MADTMDKARDAIAASSPQSAVYIGCDSIRFKKDGRWYAKYSVVVILHMDQRHGCKLFHKSEVQPDYGNLKMRLMTEVGYAVEIASELADVIGDRVFQVHLDINPDEKHKSSIALKEAQGYVQGVMGFAPHVKPDGFAATHAADHVVRH